MKLLWLLTNTSDYSIYYKIGMWALVVFCLIPWIILIFVIIFQKYQIRFFDDHGLLIEKQKYKKDAKIILPSNTEKKGFSFIGWFLDPEYTIPFSDELMPKKNLKAYGKWLANHQDEEKPL